MQARRRSYLLPVGLAIILLIDFLETSAKDELPAIIRRREHIRDADAAQQRFAALDKILVEVPRERLPNRIAETRIVVVQTRRAGIARDREPARRYGNLMIDTARTRFAADTDQLRVGTGFLRVVVVQYACPIRKRHQAECIVRVILLCLAESNGSIRHPVLAHIVFVPCHAERIFRVGDRTAAAEIPCIVRQRRRRRDLCENCIAELQRNAGVLYHSMQIPRIEGKARPAAADIERNGRGRHLILLIVAHGCAVAVRYIEPDAVFIILTEPLSEIEMFARLPPVAEAHRKPLQRLVLRALRDEVDRPPNRAVRRHTVQEHARPLEHLDALDRVHAHLIVRRDAVEPIIAHVLALQIEPANRP